MKLPVYLCLSTCLFFSTIALGQHYKAAPLVVRAHNTGEITEAKLLDSRVVTEVGPYGNYENRSVEITVGLKTLFSACEEVKDIELVSSQSSLVSALNPTDYYYQVNTLEEPDCMTGSFAPPEYLKLVLKYRVDERPASEAGKPWPKAQFQVNSNIRHLSFNGGMMAGYNQWRMYRIDYADLNNVKMTFVKTYAYVQGESVKPEF